MISNVYSRIYNSVLDFIFPLRCMHCNKVGMQTKGVCPTCFNYLEFIENPFCNICGKPFELELTKEQLCTGCLHKTPKYDYGRSIFRYNDASAKLVHSFKYSDRTDYAKYFAARLVSKYAKEIEEYDIICPVPMHKHKRIFRKYNPPSLIAREISEHLANINFITDLLIKTKNTKAQTTLGKSEREKNINNSIKGNDKYDIKGKKIILVDDVHTTGTTSNLCADILKKNGASKVFFLSISRT